MRSTILVLYFIVYCYISIWCKLRLSFKLRGRGLASFQDPSYFFVLQVTKWWVGVARMGWCIPCLPSLFYYDYLIILLAVYIHDGCMIMHAWHCWSHRAVTREDRKPMQKEYGEYRVSVSSLYQCDTFSCFLGVRKVLSFLLNYLAAKDFNTAKICVLCKISIHKITPATCSSPQNIRGRLKLIEALISKNDPAKTL